MSGIERPIRPDDREDIAVDLASEIAAEWVGGDLKSYLLSSRYHANIAALGRLSSILNDLGLAEEMRQTIRDAFGLGFFFGRFGVEDALKEKREAGGFESGHKKRVAADLWRLPATIIIQEIRNEHPAWPMTRVAREVRKRWISTEIALPATDVPIVRLIKDQ